MKKKFKKLSLLLSGFLFSFLVIGQFSTPASAKEMDNSLRNGWSFMERRNSTQVNYAVRTDIYAANSAWIGM